MHYHAEVWVAENKKIEETIDAIMLPFQQTLWDWYLIGGRWSGQHKWDILKEKNPKAYKKFWKSFEEKGLGYLSDDEDDRKTMEKNKISLFKKHFPDSKETNLVKRIDEWPRKSYKDDVMKVKELSIDRFDSYIIIIPDWKRKYEIVHLDTKGWKKRVESFMDFGYFVTVDYHN